MSRYHERPHRSTAQRQDGSRTILIAALILLAACRQAAPAAEPTITSVPPTATPLPTAAPEPTVESLSRTDIIYYEPAGESPRTLSIRYPETGERPFPWVLAMRCLQCHNSQYDTFTGELLAKGYAVVQLSTPGGGEDSFCAWAWLEDNSAEYGLDIDRAIAFSHGVGVAAMTLGVADETLWTEWLQGCPSPAPSPVHIRGVSTYGGWFMIPDGSLLAAAGSVATEMGVPRDTVLELATILQELPPADWRTSDLLDDEMRAIARRFPLYYINGPKPAEQMPAFLIIHGEADGTVPIAESQAMADALIDAGRSVETRWLPSSYFMDIVSSTNDIPQQVAEAIDTWAQGLFAQQ